ncbi:hypothetical protein GT347_25145 [Xylophilus rhododendri]|uniref:Uncharacterized protein n=1 Tax=Xylophilus rhododendri TaxID=2697032 RepID=A0A857JE86_9BURK|nr:type VI secretion system tube protein Hcp [Xylophilus rhododendri]QHJ00986.1 hypothetical protein GT347_25145 [Xylophilus rhododendri]
MSTLFLKLAVGNRALAGDATTQGFAGQIVLDTFGWSTSAKHVPTGTGTRTTVSHGHVKLGKVFDRASTALYGYMKNQQEIGSAVITLADSTLHDDKPLVMLEMSLAKCFVVSLSARAADSGSVMRVAEELVLSFETGTLRYFPLMRTAQGRESPTTYDIPKSRTQA